MSIINKWNLAVKSSGWPRWPVWAPSAEDIIKQVAHSGRWSVRGQWTGMQSKEIEFSELFAKYNKTKYCVTTTSGSSGLIIALEALDIGPGDEVIVPALTWIAPITAVLNVGAIPVLVDVDINTTCISPLAIKNAITPHTKAIIPVHLHCAVANMSEIIQIAKENGLYVIEDCSQAHGAMWEERYVGTIGDVGVFSMNQEKVLTCGEGGAVITNDVDIYDKLFRSKTDGCSFDANKKCFDDDQLIYENVCMGTNYCISEFQAAILISQLEIFDELNEIRSKNADYLDNELSKIGGITPIRQYDGVSKRTVYEYAIKIDNTCFNNKSLDWICGVLSARLGFCIHRTDVPIYRNKLFVPTTKNRYKFYSNHHQFNILTAEKYPNCEELYNSLVVFHHSILLGNLDCMDGIIKAFKKANNT